MLEIRVVEYRTTEGYSYSIDHTFTTWISALNYLVAAFCGDRYGSITVSWVESRDKP